MPNASKSFQQVAFELEHVIGLLNNLQFFWSSNSSSVGKYVLLSSDYQMDILKNVEVASLDATLKIIP